METANRFKECREKTQYTQKQVAFLIGVKPPQLSKWESGTGRPSRENCIKLAKLYNVSTDYLLGISTDEEYIESESVCFEPSTTEEYHLLSGFRSLNEAGKQYILQTLDTAVASNIYKQSDLSLGKEA